MVTLCILDGFGEKKEKLGNAVKAAGTPNLDKLKKDYPHTTILASGGAVGLPDGVMGNSEVGHLTIGAGRVILQDLKLINSEIENGKYFENKALVKALTHADKNKSNLHVMGLLSDAGVHSDYNHMFAILEFAKKFKNIKNIYIHAFLDGRDTGIHDGKKFVQITEEKIKGTNAKIGTMMGRVQVMDRENRYDRVEKAYRLLVYGEGKKYNSAMEAIDECYNNGDTDEYFPMVVIDKNSMVGDNDSLIFFNFRSDREREISYAFALDDFKEFETKKLKNFLYTTMTQYSDKLTHVNTMYPPKTIEVNLASTISNSGKKQFHISETTKYAHVTFFLNGTIEKPYKGEDRKIIDSINVKDFSEYPDMRAYEIREDVIKAIESKKYDFVVVNFSNPDMIGHTGNFDAAVQAVKTCDKCAFDVAQATLDVGGDCIIIADHGNCEEMFDKEGNKLTQHTTNPVPFILVSEKHKNARLKSDGTLANVAPTVLELMGIKKPDVMTDSMIK